MPRPWLSAFLGLCVVAALQPSALRAESLVALGDPAYGGVAPAGVEASVRAIVYPTLGMPALVRPGERFSVLLRSPCRPDLALLEAHLELVRAPDQRRPLRVLGLVADPERTDGWTLHLRAPQGLAPDSWDLVLDDGHCLRDRQASALRVYEDDERFRFAVLADEQVGDPTGLLSGGEQNGSLHPGRGLRDPAARRRLQVRQELELLDPLFVLYPGDLCFGMDYAAEYAAVVERLGAARLAVFAVPGNHDAYAIHRVGLREGWHRHVPKAAFCAGRFTPGSPIDGVTAVSGCVLQRMAETVELELELDGLDAWHASLGPSSYAFELGGLRFVGLNTYGGSAARRAAVPASLGRLRDWIELDLLAEAGLDPLLGAPLVDNYGGFLEPDVQAWLQAQSAAARAAERGLVVFGHHDPTGLYLGERGVVPNEPFGQDPVGLGSFEVWNYDQPWDSQPGDGIEIESAVGHSGVGLLRGLGSGPVTLVVGHAHYDSDRALPLPGAPADRPELEIVQATSGGAGLAHDGAYHGYRLVEVERGRLGSALFDQALGWPSVPAGNLWTEPVARADGPPDQAVVSGLPQALEGRLRFELPAQARGYRFSQDGQAILPSAVEIGTEGLVAWLPVTIPAARAQGVVAQEPEELARSLVRWEVATDNQPPSAEIGSAGRRGGRSGSPLRARSGQELRLVATMGPGEEARLGAHWSVGGLELDGERVAVRIQRPGRYRVRVRVVDVHGAEGSAERELRVRPRWVPWARARGASG